MATLFFGSPAPSVLDQQPADKSRLDHEQCDRADDVLFVLFPETQSLESYEAPRGQPTLADPPAPKLAPVEHGYSRRALDWNVFRPCAIYDLQRDFRCPGPNGVGGVDVTTDDSAPNTWIGHPIDRDA